MSLQLLFLWQDKTYLVHHFTTVFLVWAVEEGAKFSSILLFSRSFVSSVLEIPSVVVLPKCNFGKEAVYAQNVWNISMITWLQACITLCMGQEIGQQKWVCAKYVLNCRFNGKNHHWPIDLQTLWLKLYLYQIPILLLLSFIFVHCTQC